MPITRDVLESIIFKTYDRSVVRFLQNSPIYPSVWLAYAKETSATGRAKRNIAKGNDSLDNRRVDLILTPHFRSSAAELFKVLHKMATTRKKLEAWILATNGETVAVQLTFSELIYDILPLTSWWAKLRKTTISKSNREIGREQDWLNLVIGGVVASHATARIDEVNDSSKKKMRDRGTRFLEAREKHSTPEGVHPDGILYSISMNRKAVISLQHSVACTKADAGRRLFEIDGSDITWAVVDSGIDAQHPAFRKTHMDGKEKKICKPAMVTEKNRVINNTRVIATYDFTGFRTLISKLTNKSKGKALLTSLPTGDREDQSLSDQRKIESIETIVTALNDGRMLDWSVLGPLLRIPHNETKYRKPEHPHGTHVAGIIGAGLTEDLGEDMVVVGMCPKINLFDFRVLNKDGEGDEFNIIAALQFIRWINQHDGFNIHGVNLSMSLYHDVETYACGHTPVCVSANRLVDEGMVVVAAAGNQGQSIYESADTGMTSQGFRTVNITDPGNAEDVITVGATHRNEPHRYGVSYFSSKGPTGDGRIKPDVVAPGEKIYSAVLNDGIDAMDGTSMAAPHVSGAAALVMSKHRELIGRPRRIKDILCKTATDLGRERYFQGCGMIDVLRAIQSV